MQTALTHLTTLTADSTHLDGPIMKLNYAITAWLAAAFGGLDRARRKSALTRSAVRFSAGWLTSRRASS